MPRLLALFLGGLVSIAAIIGIIASLAVGTLARTPDFTQLRQEVEIQMLQPNGDFVSRKFGPKTADWVPIQSISNHLLMAVIASEDSAFYSHDGIDLFEMKESIKKDLKEKRWARGGSTLTQQVIKNVYLTKQKSLWRKFKEILWARELEKTLSKSEILCVYVNLVEWGPKIYGIRQAARHYFKTSPINLTPRQSAFLAMMLPAPVKYYTSFRNRQLTDFAERRVKHILRVMNRMGFLDESQYHDALNESLWGEVPRNTSPEESDEMVPAEDPDEKNIVIVPAPSPEPKAKPSPIKPEPEKELILEPEPAPPPTLEQAPLPESSPPPTTEEGP